MNHGAERTAGILRRGNGWTRLSALVMGAGCLRHGQIVKGLLYLGFEVLYALFENAVFTREKLVKQLNHEGAVLEKKGV